MTAYGASWFIPKKAIAIPATAIRYGSTMASGLTAIIRHGFPG